MTGFRFELALREPATGPLAMEVTELDGVPLIGHRLRVQVGGYTRDLFIVDIIWFHAPGALSKSGQITLSGNPP